MNCNIMKNIAFAAMLLLVAACNNKNNSASADERATPGCAITPELKPLIKLTQLDIAPVNSELELTGSISYDQDHLYRYQSLATGVVSNVNFNLGDYVQKGQVLAEVRTSELSGQTADLRKAEAELKLADRRLRATQKLHEDGIASDKDLQEAKNAAEVARLDIERIKQTLAIQGGNVDKGVLLIRAPMSGYIVRKKITAGDRKSVV